MCRGNPKETVALRIFGPEAGVGALLSPIRIELPRARRMGPLIRWRHELSLSFANRLGEVTAACSHVFMTVDRGRDTTPPVQPPRPTGSGEAGWNGQEVCSDFLPGCAPGLCSGTLGDCWGDVNGHYKSVVRVRFDEVGQTPKKIRRLFTG